MVVRGFALSGKPQPGLEGSAASAGTATATMSSAQPGTTRSPVGYSICTSARLSGIGASQESVPSPAMTCAHTGNAPAEPVNPVGSLSSYPTHTTTRWLPENPANQL